MRITNNMMNTAFMQNLRHNLTNLDRLQRQLSSTKAINRPSDDPVKLQQILRLDTALDQQKQYVRNIDDADAWLAATDAALNQAGSIILRAQEMAQSGANSTNDASAMNAFADEVRQLTEQMISVANANHAGRFLFAGTNTTAKPFSETIGNPYAGFSGNGNQFEYEIGPGVRMKINTTAALAFGGSTTSDANNTVEVMRQLEAALRADDKDAIQQGIENMQQAQQTLLTARSDLGARMNRLEATKQRYQDDMITLTALKSQAEDADIAEVVMYLKTQESVYRASLAAGARIIQPSLVDFLR